MDYCLGVQPYMSRRQKGRLKNLLNIKFYKLRILTTSCCFKNSELAHQRTQAKKSPASPTSSPNTSSHLTNTTYVHPHQNAHIKTLTLTPYGNYIQVYTIGQGETRITLVLANNCRV